MKFRIEMVKLVIWCIRSCGLFVQWSEDHVSNDAERRHGNNEYISLMLLHQVLSI
jgi:hypothetical protein